MMYIKNNKDSKMGPCGAPGRISAKEEHWPFKMILCAFCCLESRIEY